MTGRPHRRPPTGSPAPGRDSGRRVPGTSDDHWDPVATDDNLDGGNATDVWDFEGDVAAAGRDDCGNRARDEGDGPEEQEALG